MDGRRSEARIAEVIRECASDVVGLQELDLARARSGGVDQAARIAKHLGWHHHFHPAMQNGREQYGDAIISRHAMTIRQAGELAARAPWFCNETRGACWAEVQTEFGALNVINTHLGLGHRERIMQARLLVSDTWLGRIDPKSPVVLLGDFNFRPLSAPHRIITEQLRDVRALVGQPRGFRTYPTRLPLLAVDHIFVNDQIVVAQVMVHRSALARAASDHFPLIADLNLKPQSE